MVYIDDMYKNPIGQFRRMKMSHMVADTTEELIAMAEKIGIDKKCIQKPGTGQEHFDVAIVKRKLAIRHGAIEMSMYKLCAAMVERKSNNEKLILNEQPD